MKVLLVLLHQSLGSFTTVEQVPAAGGQRSCGILHRPGGKNHSNPESSISVTTVMNI